MRFNVVDRLSTNLSALAQPPIAAHPRLFFFFFGHFCAKKLTFVNWNLHVDHDGIVGMIFPFIWVTKLLLLFFKKKLELFT